MGTDTDDDLDGLKLAFTSSLEGYSRAEACDLVERHDGRFTSNFSGNMDHLVLGSNPGTRKLKDAEEVDVPMLDEVAFWRLLDDCGIFVSRYVSEVRVADILQLGRKR